MDFWEYFSEKQNFFTFDDINKLGITCDQLLNGGYALSDFKNLNNIVDNYSILIKKMFIEKKHLKKAFFNPTELMNFIKNKDSNHIMDINDQLEENFNLKNDNDFINKKNYTSLYDFDVKLKKKNLFLKKEDFYDLFWTPNDFKVLKIDKSFLETICDENDSKVVDFFKEKIKHRDIIDFYKNNKEEWNEYFIEINF